LEKGRGEKIVVMAEKVRIEKVKFEKVRFARFLKAIFKNENHSSYI